MFATVLPSRQPTAPRTKVAAILAAAAWHQAGARGPGERAGARGQGETTNLRVWETKAWEGGGTSAVSGQSSGAGAIVSSFVGKQGESWRERGERGGRRGNFDCGWALFGNCAAKKREARTRCLLDTNAAVLY